MSAPTISQNPFEVLAAQMKRMEDLLLELVTQRNHDSKKESPEANSGIDLAVSITGKTKKTIYNLVNKRKIPHYKKGNKLYFKEAELQEWIKVGKRLTTEEVKVRI
jgi:excisionase family DNA binding protein